jgi:hypothetical protein
MKVVDLLASEMIKCGHTFVGINECRWGHFGCQREGKFENILHFDMQKTRPLHHSNVFEC